MELIQLTDCHLLADPAARMGGIDTHASLAAVIAAVGRLDYVPDAILATGDLTHKGEAGAYGRLRILFRDLPAPVYCLPGNHDHRETFAAALPDGSIHALRSLRRDGWQIIFLDSLIPGRDEGRLGAAERAALDEALGQKPHDHALVCLHHHPVEVGAAWRTEIGLKNPDDLFAIIDRHAHVRGLLFGHIHQAFDGRRKGVRLLGTPSSCFQFFDDNGRLGIADDPPAYRRLTLRSDGAIDSSIRWVGRHRDYI